MFIIKLYLKFILTMDLLKTRFIPEFKEGMDSLARDWRDDINPGSPEFCPDSLYLDRKTGYWYIWDRDSDKNVWRLHRCSTYFLWRAYMASCEIIADYLKDIKDGKEPSQEELCSSTEGPISSLLRNPGVMTIKEVYA